MGQDVTWEEMKVWVRGIHWEITVGLKITNKTQLYNERKMVQLYYFVPGCVISMLSLSIGIR